MDNKPLILWGGVDINPKLYGESPLSYTQKSNDNRDTLEISNIHRAIEDKTPIIGVCRGAQLLCILNGGSLYQHSEPSSQNHKIQTKDGKLFNTVSADHHQIMKPKGNYILYGYNPDPVKVWITENLSAWRGYTTEIAYWPDTKCLAIQPHPEWEEKNSDFLNWLNNLIKELEIKYVF